MVTRGTVRAARGHLLEVRLPLAAVGDGVRILGARGTVPGSIVALSGQTSVVAAHGALDGIAAGDAVFSGQSAQEYPVGTALLGRALDACGEPLDALVPPLAPRRALRLEPPAPEARESVQTALWTGIRCIDALLTIGRGARIGFFGAPGAGKSTLLQSVVRGASADAVVVALVGERGREAEHWIRNGPLHACTICATSDRPAAERVRAAQAAMLQAATLRSRGLHVLVILDSLARYAAALREIAVAAGEPAGRGGYPASVFAEMALLLETAGPAHGGSVTVAATVLSDGDERDPVSDAARSLLDGHIALSPALAQAGHFPAIDVLASASRTMQAVAAAPHAGAAARVRDALARIARTAEARSLGLQPTDAADLCAVACESRLEAFLRQGPEPEAPAHTLSQLAQLADTLE